MVKKKKKALTKQERRIASSVNTKPKKSFKQNKIKANASNSIKTKIYDFKDKITESLKKNTSKGKDTKVKNKTSNNTNANKDKLLIDSKNKTNYLETPIEGFYIDKITRRSKDAKQHISLQINADDKTWTRIGPLTHKKKKGQRYFNLRTNPNPLDSEPSYLRKYVNTSSLGTRGEYMPNYKLSNEDHSDVVSYLAHRQSNKKNT